MVLISAASQKHALELSPFLRKNAVPENKAHVSPFGRAFSPLKNGFGINISEDTLVCPKRSFLCNAYLLGKRQKL